MIEPISDLVSAITPIPDVEAELVSARSTSASTLRLAHALLASHASDLAAAAHASSVETSNRANQNEVVDNVTLSAEANAAEVAFQNASATQSPVPTPNITDPGLSNNPPPGTDATLDTNQSVSADPSVSTNPNSSTNPSVSTDPIASTDPSLSPDPSINPSTDANPTGDISLHADHSPYEHIGPDGCVSASANLPQG